MMEVMLRPGVLGLLRKRKRLILAVAAALPLSAEASLLGDSVDIQWLAPDVATVFGSETVTVGAGPELVCEALAQFQTCVFGGYDNGTIAFDIEAWSVGMVFSGGTATATALTFNGPRFFGLDSGASISGVSLATSIPGLDASRVAFGADWVSVNLGGLVLDSLASAVFWRVDLATDSGDGGDGDGDGIPVPAPATPALLAMGLAGLGLARRRWQARP